MSNQGIKRAELIAAAKAKASRNFRRLLATGKPVAFEDALHDVVTPDDCDRRGLSSVVTELKDAGVIEFAGYRISKKRSHHSATKRLWKLRSAVTA